LSLSLTIGFLLHLVLDEIWAATNFHGTPFIPNKAFGSALKLYSHSRTTNIFTYACLVILIIGNYQTFAVLSAQLFHAV
jgi:hypothetical protein